MRRILPFLLVLLWTGFSDAKLVSLSPQDILSEAQCILIGVVREVRVEDQHPKFIVQPEIVYKGNVGRILIAVPLPAGTPAQDNSEKAADLRVGNRLLLFLRISENGSLGPAADFNWVARVEENLVTGLFLGANIHEWNEDMYIEAFNEYLAVNPGETLPEIAIDGGARDRKTDRAASEINPAIFFMIAGVSLIGLVISARVQKRFLTRREKSRTRTGR